MVKVADHLKSAEEFYEAGMKKYQAEEPNSITSTGVQLTPTELRACRYLENQRTS